MRLEPLYRIHFTTPEAWKVETTGNYGKEGQSFLIAEGRCTGRINGRYRGANYPRQRTDGTLTPDFRGVLETEDGATVLFAWRGLGRRRADSGLELVGSMTHVSDDDRYAWLNDRVCAVSGEVHTRADGPGFNVVLDVAELASDARRLTTFPPPGQANTVSIVPALAQSPRLRALASDGRRATLIALTAPRHVVYRSWFLPRGERFPNSRLRRWE